jgi:hypothetical protein
LGFKHSFLLFGLSASLFPAALLFLLLNLALADLFLKSTKSLGLGILLPLEFQLPLACLTPVNVLAKPTTFVFIRCGLLTLDA